MIKPLRCRCGLVWQRRHLLQAVESSNDLICPNPTCARVMTYSEIEKVLKGIGELSYDKPTQPKDPE